MNKLIFAFVLLIAGQALAEPVKIVAFGDSLTQGFGLPADQGFVPQLQRWLDAQGAEVMLINAGVSGDTTAGGLARINWTLSSDVDGMILALGANDMLRGLPPEMARTNLDGMLRAAGDVEVLLVGVQAPGNYGAEYKAAFDAIYPDLAAMHGALLQESFFAGLPSDDPARLMGYLQADGIHPNADGVALIVDGIGPTVLELLARLGQ